MTDTWEKSGILNGRICFMYTFAKQQQKQKTNKQQTNNNYTYIINVRK